MYIFDVDSIGRALETLGTKYKEFLRVETMSAGLYRLKAGEKDPQQPHGEDEVYFVIRGKARFEAGEALQEVKAGTVIYVEARRPHRFVDVEEDLEVLVLFAPAEGSAGAAR